MSRLGKWSVTVLTTVSVAIGATGVALATGGGVHWGSAIKVPGTAALDPSSDASVESVSCASAGHCAAGGSYVDGAFHRQAFVVGEKKGLWGKAVEVPGTAALNLGGSAEVASLSCATTGNCAAGGSYEDGAHRDQVFVVAEKKGVWGKAVEVPGTAALNLGGHALIDSVSCASAGNCAAGGHYMDGSFHHHAFLVAEKSGVWGKAVEVPGTAALNLGGDAAVQSVSCRSAGSCAAGGYYTDGSGNIQAFVVGGKNGVWGKAIEVPGTAALNLGGWAMVSSVSCASAGNCVAGGNYMDGTYAFQAFVVVQKNGVWGQAVEVPGTAGLNQGGYAGVASLSCTSAGTCAAGGFYRDGANNVQAFVVAEKSGVWGQAVEVPGTAGLNLGGYAIAASVSCASAGNCAAGGHYVDGSGHDQAFAAGEKNGVWGAAVEVPGTAPLNQGGYAVVNAV